MIHTIRVNAEHEYEVVIGCDWQSTLKGSLASYTRVALVYSTAMRDRVKGFQPVNTEVHTLKLQMVKGLRLPNHCNHYGTG